MLILYNNGVPYDYMSSTLIEGMLNLNHTVLTCNWFPNAKHIAPEEIEFAAKRADLIVTGNAHSTFQNPIFLSFEKKLIYVDGGDEPILNPVIEFSPLAIFKREFREGINYDCSAPVFSCPFAAEDRYFVPSVFHDYDVVFLANPTNPIRMDIVNYLTSQQEMKVLTGNSNERAYGTLSPLPLPCPNYHQSLARSKIGISAHGGSGAHDSARYWETLAAGCFLLTQEVAIGMPNPFVDGIHCGTFNDIDELKSKLSYYTKNDRVRDKIIDRAKIHLHAHHTTKARAQYFLNICNTML